MSDEPDNGGMMDSERDASRLQRTVKTEELRRLVLEGIGSGPELDGDRVFAHLRAKFVTPVSGILDALK